MDIIVLETLTLLIKTTVNFAKAYQLKKEEVDKIFISEYEKLKENDPSKLPEVSIE